LVGKSFSDRIFTRFDLLFHQFMGNLALERA
jgi:hypothetical protein